MKKSTRNLFGILSVCFFALFIMIKRGTFDEIFWGDEIRQQQKREENMQNLMNSNVPSDRGFNREYSQYIIDIHVDEISQKIAIGDKLMVQDDKESYEVTIKNIFTMKQEELSELKSGERQMVYVYSLQKVVGNEETEKQFVIMDSTGNQIGKASIQNMK